MRKGMERMQATIIGAAVSLLALIAVDTFPFLQTVRPAVVGFTVVVVMAITILLGWLDSLVLAAATVVVIMILPAEENIYHYSLSRTVVTFVGIVVATAVNALLGTPRYSGPMWQNINKLAQITSHLYRQAVESFCSRKLDLARQMQESLAEGEEFITSISTRSQWIREEAGLRERMRRSYRSEVEVLSRALELLGAVRQSASVILKVTAELLDRSPRYADQPAPVYEILWDLAQPSFGILGRIQARLSGNEPGEKVPGWTDEAHLRFIKAIRDGYRDVFPLVELSVVEFEIRRTTQLLAELDDALADLAKDGK